MTPEDWGIRFGLFQNSAFGAAHTLFQMGPFRYPNRDRRIEGYTTPGPAPHLEPDFHGCAQRENDS